MLQTPYVYIQSKTLALIASNFCKVLCWTAREEEISLCTHFHKRKWPRFAHRKFHSDLFKTQLLTNFPTACFTSPLHHTPKSKCWELYCFRIFFTFFLSFSQNLNAMVNKWSGKVGALKCSKEILQFLQAFYLKIKSGFLCLYSALESFWLRKNAACFLYEAKGKIFSWCIL